MEDTKKRNRLVLENLKLAKSVAGEFAGRAEMEDMIGEANVALVKAAGRFDENRGTAFPVYARAYIRGELLNYVSHLPAACLSLDLEDEDGLALLEKIEDEDAGRNFDAVENCRMTGMMMSALDEDEIQIITLHYGLDGKRPLTLEKIAEFRGTTISSVYRKESTAIRKMQRRAGIYRTAA